MIGMQNLCKNSLRDAKLRLFILILAILAVSCSIMAAPKSQRIIELKVNQLPEFSSQDARTKADVAVLRRFMALHPNVKLVRGTGLQIAGGANTMDMVPMMQIAGDISPAVIYVNFRMSDTYIQKGFLKPLDDFVKKIPKDELDRRVPPAVRPVIYRLGPDGKKHWYAIPTGRLVRVLTWRRDLFAKAGLDPDRPPKTWTEFLDYSKKLCKPKSNQYGMGFYKGDVSSWDFANLVWSAGGKFVDVDDKGKWTPMFNAPPVIDAMYFYAKMNTMPWTGPDGQKYHGVAGRDTNVQIQGPGDPFAMVFSYLDDRLNIYQPELLGYAPVPHMEGRKSASEINCTMLGLYAGIKDPEMIQAAWDYMSFQDSDEANQIRVKIFIQNGYGRFVSPILLEKYGYTDYLKSVDKDWIRVYKDAMINGIPEPYGKNCAVVYRELSRPLEQVINDKVVVKAIEDNDEAAARARIKEIANSAQVDTEKRMYGIVPVKVAATRHVWTIIFLIAAAVAFTIATAYLLKVFRQSAPTPTPGQKKTYLAAILILPAALTVLIWQYYPLMRGTIMAFQDYNVMGGSEFVGLSNFTDILFDPGFWHSLYITLLYTALYMIFAFISPIVLALLLTEVPRGKIFFRTIFYLPAVLSGLVVIFLWKSFYKPAGLMNNVLNPILELLHIAPMSVDWLSTPMLAMAAVLLPVVWAGMGPGCLIYLAALKTIPEEFYEAADVDGAGVIRKIFGITLPSIKMLVMINAVGAFIGAFMSSETIFAMTGGGPYTPYGATEVVGLQLFYTAFVYLKFGVANAMAWVLGFMLIGFTMIQLRTLSRVEFKGGR
jgi:multiple sugar transport system permease protein